MNTLESIIRSKREPLGNTEAGANWALQALHPSCGPFQLRGIPDSDSFPCVCMDYEAVVAIPPPAGCVDAWQCNLTVNPHPTQPCCFSTTTVGGLVGYGGIYNPSYLPTGAVYSTMASTFAAQCSSYRMLYCGATVDLDASALTNGGSVVAAQMPITSIMRNYSLTSAVGPVADVHILDSNYDVNFPGPLISQLPGAFMGLARDGCYMPVKIDVTQPWVSSLDVVTVNAASPATAVHVAAAGAGLRNLTLPVAAPPAGVAFPFYGSAFYGNGALIIPAWVNGASNLIADVVVQPQQKNAGIMFFYNLNPAATLTVKLRWGVEMRVYPTSPLAPAMVPSAMHDPLALTAYTDIAGSLPWAYPSSYNSLETLVPKIMSVWHAIKPVVASGLQAIPHPLAQIAGHALGAMSGRKTGEQPNTTELKSSDPTGARTLRRRANRKR